MPAMDMTEVIAWALIAAGLGFWALRSRGVPTAAIAAGLAALATKAALLDGI